MKIIQILICLCSINIGSFVLYHLVTNWRNMLTWMTKSNIYEAWLMSQMITMPLLALFILYLAGAPN